LKDIRRLLKKLAATLNNSILFYDNQLSSVFKTIDHLKKTFPNFVVVKNEEEYFNSLKEHSFDIITMSLDVMPMDGIAVTKETLQFKEEKKPFIIIYSNKQDDFLYELAFNSGVDSFVNYQQTPVLMELLIKALIRRIQTKKTISQNSNGISVNEEEFLVIRNNTKIELPKKEFKILLLLYQNQNKFFSKNELALSVWNDESVAKKRTIDVHIYNIRQLFGKKTIQSQKGKGYRLNKKYFN
jgi:two-component system alkaline phosphatase synthesis response regulator PhoP